MRDHIFKALRTDGQGWVEGCLAFVYVDAPKASIYSQVYVRSFDVDVETICEYTGLADSGEENIFEDDILLAPVSEEKGTVKFMEGSFVVDRGDAFYPVDLSEWLDAFNVCCRIGNIHDPEVRK